MARQLRSVPGVGPVLAQTLIARLPELGHLTRRQIAGAGRQTLQLDDRRLCPPAGR